MLFNLVKISNLKLLTKVYSSFFHDFKFSPILLLVRHWHEISIDVIHVSYSINIEVQHKVLKIKD